MTEPNAPEPRTHDFGPGSRNWGHDYAITCVEDGGRRVRASGWGSDSPGPIAEGDFLLLEAPDHRRATTRYQVTSIRHETNPGDMWHADLVFTPRMYVTAEEKGAHR